MDLQGKKEPLEQWEQRQPLSRIKEGGDGDDAAGEGRNTNSSNASTVIVSPRSNQSLQQRRSQQRRSQSRSSLGVLLYDQTPPVSHPELETIDPSEELDDTGVPWWTSKRFRLAILTFFGFVCLYSQRVNLSIAMVAMVSHADKSNHSGSHHDANPKCPALSKKATEAEFKWDKELEGLILGAFFWGYLVLQVAGGRLSEKFGAKKVIAFSMFPVAILNLLTPLAARTSPYLLLVLRVFVGIGESTMYPSAQALWARWAPPHERSQLIGLSYAGGQFGNALMFPIAGYLCEYGPDGGWPFVFYFIGSVGFFWSCMWVLFAHDTPEENRSITEIEKRYINLSLGRTEESKKNEKKRPPVPWCSVLTSMPFWAILVGHTCGNYGAYMLLTKIPSYMKEVLKFDIKANGLYSMMPYLAFWLIIVVGGVLADGCITRGILSIKYTRKLFAFFGFLIPAVTLIGVGFMDCDQYVWAVFLLTLSVGFCGLQFNSVFVNHSDIAPKYAGTLFGMTNTAATVPGIISPYVVSAMTPNGTREEWQKTFYLAAGIYFFGAFFYCIFSQTEIQSWAKDPEIEEKPESVADSKEGQEIPPATKVVYIAPDDMASEHEV